MIRTQVPLATWPGTAAVPSVEGYDDVVAFGPPWNRIAYVGAIRQIPVPDELVLRQFLDDVDCDDAASIAEFERTHGRLGTRWASHDDGYVHFPKFVAEVPKSEPAWDRAASTQRAFLTNPLVVLQSDYPDLAAQHQDLVGVGSFDWDDTTVADWSKTARALRACVRQLEAATLPNTDRLIPRVWQAEGFAVETAEDARFWFKVVVNDRLRPFHMYVHEPGEDAQPPWDVELQNALALQIANYSHEQAAYHRCANEKCNGLFIHQQGGAPKGQHKSVGVMYCTPECAKRQSVRNWRKKQREQGA